MAPGWLALLAPLPDDVVIERKPVVSAALRASGTVDAIEGWETISVNLSDVASGLRHVLITLDASGALISGGDGMIRHRQERRGGERWTIYEHENIGGRFESDGSFRGTRWHTITEHLGDDDKPARTSNTPSTPSAADVEQLRALLHWVLERAPAAPPP